MRFRPYDVRLWQAQGMCYKEIGRYEGTTGQELQFTCPRYREAIECLKRALIGADPHEITINLKLAKLHHKLEEYNEAVAYNRRVVEVCQFDCAWFSQQSSLLYH
jgi:anaphase-promoting complex subunit 8